MISHDYLNYNDLITESTMHMDVNILYDIFYITTDILYNERKCKSIMFKNTSNTINDIIDNTSDNTNNTDNNADNINQNKDINSNNNNENTENINIEKNNEDNKDDKTNENNENNEQKDRVDNKEHMNSKNIRKNDVDKLIHKLYKNISLNLHPDKGNKTNHFSIAVSSKEKKDISKLIYIYILNNLDTTALNLTQNEIYILKMEKDKLTEKLSNIKTISQYLTSV